MPNVKIFIDEGLYAERKEQIKDMLPSLRETLCETLSVGAAACQLAVIPVLGLPDQPLANLEFQYLGTESRTPDFIRGLCIQYRDILEGVLGCVPAVRATPLDVNTYVAVK